MKYIPTTIKINLAYYAKIITFAPITNWVHYLPFYQEADALNVAKEIREEDVPNLKDKGYAVSSDL